MDNIILKNLIYAEYDTHMNENVLNNDVNFGGYVFDMNDIFSKLRLTINFKNISIINLNKILTMIISNGNITGYSRVNSIIFISKNNPFYILNNNIEDKSKISILVDLDKIEELTEAQNRWDNIISTIQCVSLVAIIGFVVYRNTK